MTVSIGHNGAQGIPLPENGTFAAFTYGLPEDAFEKLTRAKEACDLLQLLFSEHSCPGSFSAHSVPGLAALMDYLRADLTDVTRCCALLKEDRV
ncbi:hypothetical protein A6J33_006935 [Pantoea sp. FDAARGOS_194]|uniref:hypothetical protein n=1 Tax=Pantoea TaxID=53335 RepID=UPI000BB55305|nr:MULTISPECIES: hypothetical protein [Pantoea]PNK62528.1 hypothetical protein A6J33_006935 [Pantoea sp. FDAARGOS_194]